MLVHIFWAKLLLHFVPVDEGPKSRRRDRNSFSEFYFKLLILRCEAISKVQAGDESEVYGQGWQTDRRTCRQAGLQEGRSVRSELIQGFQDKEETDLFKACQKEIQASWAGGMDSEPEEAD